MNGQEKKMNRETIFLFERTRGHTNADIDTGKAGGERSTKKEKKVGEGHVMCDADPARECRPSSTGL